ncbi:hypothetical protein BDN70DRAFT_915550 [Pholiota conissans]|uniref:PARP catalytic domain-containing protein n=1 Tax=Pholiota conissans TaxID=109636 RepID=A0A9P5YQ02_9AGAR|nr:hypothetical protein BDN70DRAFT_915550 [Pholiota conissans]
MEKQLRDETTVQIQGSHAVDQIFENDDDDDDINEQPVEETYYPGINLCIICQERPPYFANGRRYPTCGLSCAGILAQIHKPTPPVNPSPQYKPDNMGVQRMASQTMQSVAGPLRQPNHGVDNVTNRLQHVVIQGSESSAQNYSRINTPPCVYCHRRPKVAGNEQCNSGCMELARVACLLCKCRPKLGKYHFCGRTCKMIATKTTPLILEIPAGHETYEFVENKFKNSWKTSSNKLPIIKRIFKIIEGNEFLQPYDRYKMSVGNEVFRYHGTTRSCILGSGNQTQLCTNSTCSLCSILKTSFKTSRASPKGSFGPGIYSSAASNKACGYVAKAGVIILTKVILGNSHEASARGMVKACPPGFTSVVYSQNGPDDETVVYSDDAIRPVFLITF